MLNPPPAHVAIIMDGNGRWAERQGLPRVRGHQIGGDRVEEVINFAPSLGIKYLTLYAFSKENWQRPKAEIAFLMDRLSDYLDKKVPELHKNNVRFNVIGRVEDLSEKIQEKIRKGMDLTRNNTGLFLTIALSYSSQCEIADACKKIAQEVLMGKISPDAIDEKTVASHLYTAGVPDPDLLIRTSGEMRVSNFLLLQIAYAEIVVTEKLWPEFDEAEFTKAIDVYRRRERRFGRSKVEVSK